MSNGSKLLTLCGVVAMGATLVAFTGPERLALPGDLPRPLANMSSGQLFAFGSRLRFDNGPVQDRVCARGACKGRIDAVRDQTPGPATISANGTIVARLVNLGRGDGGADEGPEERYRTARGQHDFYLIALKTPTGWAWTVRVAVRNGVGAPVETAAGNWVACQHDPNNPNHPKGRSQFASCSGTTRDDDLVRAAGPRAPREYTIAQQPNNPLDPGWLTCTDGCCTAGQ